jgi:hypothetical protein
MPETYHCDLRTARKAHKCCECYREIKPGEKYNYHHGVWDGVGMDFKVCLSCEKFRKKIAEFLIDEFDNSEGVPFELLSEVARENGFADEWEKIKRGEG